MTTRSASSFSAPARVAAVRFGQRDRLFGAGERAAMFVGDALRFARPAPRAFERGVGLLAVGADRSEGGDPRAMLFFGAFEFTRFGFDCGEVDGGVMVFGAAAADHPPRHHEVAVAGDENGAVTVQVRRGQRGAQVIGEHHVTEHRFGDRREARFDVEHLDQAARDAGRVDRLMRRDGGVGLLHKVHPAGAILFEDFDCAERKLRRLDNDGVHLRAEHRFEGGLERERRAHHVFEDRRIDSRAIAVERFEDRAKPEVDAVRSVIGLQLAARDQHAAQRIDARGQMVERGARFDLALGGLAPRAVELGGHCARSFEVGFGRAHRLARRFERGGECGRLERGRFETLFEISALAGEIAEAAANDGGLAHDVRQVVLAFFAAAVRILELASRRFVLERDFLERGVGVAATGRDFAREGRACFGAIGARESRIRLQLDQPRTQLDFELRGGVEAPLQESARACALAGAGVKILELALSAAELRARRLRGRGRRLDLLANRRGACARIFQ